MSLSPSHDKQKVFAGSAGTFWGFMLHVVPTSVFIQSTLSASLPVSGDLDAWVYRSPNTGFLDFTLHFIDNSQ